MTSQSPRIEFVDRPVEIVVATSLRQAERDVTRREFHVRWGLSTDETGRGTSECS